MSFEQGISRRALLRMGGIMGAGALGAAALSGCAPQAASEGGAHVACVQNTSVVNTSGNMGGYVDLEKTSPAGVQACISYLMEKSDYRSDRKLLNVWAQNSSEALQWWAAAAEEGGVDNVLFDSALNLHGYDVQLHANTYFHIDGANNTAAAAIAEGLAQDGAEFFYDTPAVQLYKEGDAVTGVICRNADDQVILFKAAKGVILAAGDYSGNMEMREYLCPDLKGFGASMENRDGSALMMGGGQAPSLSLPYMRRWCMRVPRIVWTFPSSISAPRASASCAKAPCAPPTLTTSSASSWRRQALPT